MKGIQIKLHIIGTYGVCKTFLSCFYNNSLAYFRKDIRSQ